MTWESDLVISPTIVPVSIHMLWSVPQLSWSVFICDQSCHCLYLRSDVQISSTTVPILYQMFRWSCHWPCRRSDVVISPTTVPICVQLYWSILPLCVCLRADWARRAGAWAQPRGWSRASWRRGKRASWARRSSGGCAASWPRPSTAWTPPPSWRRNCGRKSTPPSAPPSTSPLSRTCSTRRSPFVCVWGCVHAWFLQDPPSPQRKVNLELNWRMVQEKKKRGGGGERGR